MNIVFDIFKCFSTLDSYEKENKTELIYWFSLYKGKRIQKLVFIVQKTDNSD